MKRIVILLLITLLTKTISFSSNISQEDTTVSITPRQLKETNLIFIEHDKLLTENRLLYNQLENYKLDNSILTRTDSIRQLQMRMLSLTYNSEISRLNLEKKKKSRALLGWKIGGVTVSVGLLLLLVFK